MDVFAPCDALVSEDVNNALELMSSLSCHKQCFCGDTSNNVIGEHGSAVCDIPHAQGFQELVLDHTPAPNGESVISAFEETSSEEIEESEVDEISSAAAISDKVLSKCATFPLSKESVCHASVLVQNEISEIAKGGNCSTRSDSRICTRSISLPTSSELVSALKGSREKLGGPLTKLKVKWAADVYDPPCTSLSHTVTGHSQHRSRANKRNSKHKHKGKSSRGSNSEKRHYSNCEKKHQRRSSGNPERSSKSLGNNDVINSKLYSNLTNDTGNSDLLSMSPAADDSRKSERHPMSPTQNNRYHLSDFCQSTVDFVDFTGQESNCGSSFLRTSISKVHISVAEAT